jgi:hypothetical protein
VVGHDVHHQPHPPLLEGGRQRVQVAVGPDLGVQAGVVDDVVAVQAARTRDQKRRRVDVGDAERVEVIDQRGCVAKREVLVELKAVAATGDPGRHRDRAPKLRVGLEITSLSQREGQCDGAGDGGCDGGGGAP